MDRRTPTAPREASSSSLAAPASELKLVKAAARAWYQHGSGAAGARAPRRKSHHQLDTRAVVESSMVEPSPAIPLLDAYEIERIKRELERLIAWSRSGRGEKAATVKEEDEVLEIKRVAVAARTKAAGGFLVRHAAAVCSLKGGAVEPVAVGRRRRPPPAVG
ncbi:hypothetical protein Cni_G28929 [Canna indica]|uniref:Uncharacterized protein n=1 Tax=Canna indica TaxID=4628 RepID=A0AAQ3L3D5_9LILI|nr:hypothetical protein Cni_G28929 [Canna indica]